MVAIPLEQGRFSMRLEAYFGEGEWSQSLWSRDGFSITSINGENHEYQSQSLWSRDGFSI